MSRDWSIVVNTNGRLSLEKFLSSYAQYAYEFKCFLVFSGNYVIPQKLLQYYTNVYSIEIGIYHPTTEWDMLSAREYATENAPTEKILIVDDDVVFTNLLIEEMLEIALAKKVAYGDNPGRPTFTLCPITKTALLSVTKPLQPNDRYIFKDGFEDSYILSVLGYTQDNTIMPIEHNSNSNKWYHKINLEEASLKVTDPTLKQRLIMLKDIDDGKLPFESLFKKENND